MYTYLIMCMYSTSNIYLFNNLFYQICKLTITSKLHFRHHDTHSFKTENWIWWPEKLRGPVMKCRQVKVCRRNMYWYLYLRWYHLMWSAMYYYVGIDITTPYVLAKNKSHVISNQLYTGLILGFCPANERSRYKVTPSLIGLVQT